MTLTDPIADMLTRIRNAALARHDIVNIPSSKIKVEMAKILKNEGFIKDYQLDKNDSPQGLVKLKLHYDEDNQSAISKLKRVSKPGLRVYVRKGEIPRYYGGMGVAILSTSKGVMTGKEAWRQHIGGELLCYIW